MSLLKMLSEGKIATFKPPFKINGNYIDDSKGQTVCEMGSSRAALKDIVAALNAYTKATPIKEDSNLQALGKQLKSGPKAAAEPEVEVEPEIEVEPEVEDAAKEQVEFKIGDVVKPLKGPHAGELHDVIKVFSDGSLGIKPKELDDAANKYVKKQAKIKADEVELNEGLKYENPKSFGRKLFNKVIGTPSGPYKYKVGDTVKYEMYPAQEGGSGTGKITKLLDGHHYLVNGKPVNQNEIKKLVQTESLLVQIDDTEANERAKLVKLGEQLSNKASKPVSQKSLSNLALEGIFSKKKPVLHTRDITPEERKWIKKYFPSSNVDMKIRKDEFIFPRNAHGVHGIGHLSFYTQDDVLMASVGMHTTPAEASDPRKSPLTHIEYKMQSEQDFKDLQKMLETKGK